MVPKFERSGDKSATLIKPLRLQIASLCDHGRFGHSLAGEIVQGGCDEALPDAGAALFGIYGNQSDATDEGRMERTGYVCGRGPVMIRNDHTIRISDH